jgi:arylamine N-acetyltransferase
MSRLSSGSDPSSRAGRAFADHFGLRPDRPDRSLLEDACSAFSTIPYENLTKLLRKLSTEPGPDRLRLADVIVEEYVSLGAGGTCFSLTNALVGILSSFGFDARPVMGDMKHGADIHCAVLVEAPYGDYVLDPGYLVAEPVPATGGSVSVGSSTLTWVADSPGRISMFVERGSGPEKRYELKLAEIAGEEFLGHWQRSFDAPGMNSLHLCRAGGGERLYAHNSNLRIEARSGKRNVKLREDWAGSVSALFGLDGRLAAQALAAWSATKASR